MLLEAVHHTQVHSAVRGPASDATTLWEKVLDVVRVLGPPQLASRRPLLPALLAATGRRAARLGRRRVSVRRALLGGGGSWSSSCYGTTSAPAGPASRWSFQPAHQIRDLPGHRRDLRILTLDHRSLLMRELDQLTPRQRLQIRHTKWHRTTSTTGGAVAALTRNDMRTLSPSTPNIGMAYGPRSSDGRKVESLST